MKACIYNCPNCQKLKNLELCFPDNVNDNIKEFLTCSDIIDNDVYDDLYLFARMYPLDLTQREIKRCCFDFRTDSNLFRKYINTNTMEHIKTIYDNFYDLHFCAEYFNKRATCFGDLFFYNNKIYSEVFIILEIVIDIYLFQKNTRCKPHDYKFFKHDIDEEIFDIMEKQAESILECKTNKKIIKQT